MDDYYSLLGVDADAATDDIRTAYRDRKAALEGKGDKPAVARVNKAWNVLSDPYQRGRYDEQRTQAAEDGGLDVSDSDTPDVEGAPPRRRRMFEPPDRNAPPPQPTIVLPAGARFPAPRKRVTAMAIDLFMILLFFVGLNVLLPVVVEDRHPEQADLLDALQDRIDLLDAREDDVDDAENEREDAEAALVDAEDRAAAEERLETAQLTEEDAAAQLEATEEPAAALLERCDAGGYDTQVETDEGDDPPTVRDRLDECALDALADTQGLQLLMIEGFFVVSSLYLVVPSAFTGQTLGKKLQGIRVIRQDGSPLGWRGAIKRYGLLVLATNVLYLLLRELAGALVLVAVMGWMRNPNQQGMHDRAAKTIVVEA
ncbi:MAG: RDD family protein [Actinomycetota bacterium]